MDYRLLGKSTAAISRIGFGCMSLGESDADNARLLHRAIDLGINFFDTADLYQQGRNEETVGKALKEKRRNLIIATKVGNQVRPGGNGWDWNPRKEYILLAVNESLRRLQTDYIDLYQLHGGTINDPIDETIEAFEILKQQGKILFYGISSIRPNVIRAYAYRSNTSSVMMQYSLLDRRPEESCLHLLAEKNIAVLARGGLAGGLLVNKPAKAYLNYDEEEVKKAVAGIQLASAAKRSNTQTALQFVLQQPAIASAVVGIRTMEQLEDAAQTINTAALTENETGLLRQALPLNYYKEHR
jgi:aryl-alcohol dehydrogenase-like predicted oxidoreductase